MTTVFKSQKTRWKQYPALTLIYAVNKKLESVKLEIANSSQSLPFSKNLFPQPHRYFIWL